MNKIAVAISGGVDSIVSAHILKKKGYVVEGIHFLTGYENKDRIEKIKRVANDLKINLSIIDVKKEFEEKVVKYFIKEYISGKTPNPCIFCNAEIKFGTLLNFIKKNKIPRLATGHYAKIVDDTLFKAFDKKKDQSYFLSFLKKEVLKNILFPLSDITKKDVLKYAKNNKIEPIFKKESQDICFVKHKSYKNFLKNKGVASKKGDIKTVEGKIISVHTGLTNYTIGQRRKLNCPAKEPYYVFKIDTLKNELILGFRKDIEKTSCTIKNINLFEDLPIKKKTAFKTKLRYRNKETDSTVYIKNKSEAIIEFASPQFAITPGQVAVFYDKDKLVGSGIIKD